MKARWGRVGGLGSIYRAEDDPYQVYYLGDPAEVDVMARIEQFMGLLCEDRTVGRILREQQLRIGPGKDGLLRFLPLGEDEKPRVQEYTKRAVRFVSQPYIRALFEVCGLRMWGVHKSCVAR